MPWTIRILIGMLVLITLFALFISVVPFIPGCIVDKNGKELSTKARVPFMVLGVLNIILFVSIWGLVIILYKDMKEFF